MLKQTTVQFKVQRRRSHFAVIRNRVVVRVVVGIIFSRHHVHVAFCQFN